MKTLKVFSAAVVILAAASFALAQEAPAPGILTAKVTDVAIFKTGSGIFRYEGEGIVKDGKLVLGETPSPAFGTLWFYALDGGVTVESVDARDISPKSEAPISDYYTLIHNNPGKRAKIVMKDWTLEGTILPTDGGTPQIFLKTETGVAAIPQGELRYAEVADAKTTVERSTQKREISLTLKGAAEGQKVRIGYVCLQNGIRWLPSYHIDLEGATAHMALAASIVNDIADISGARASFVVGQPLFTLSNLLAPIVQSNKDMRLGEFYAQEVANVAANSKQMGVNAGRYQADYNEFMAQGEYDGNGRAERASLARKPIEVGMETTGASAGHLFYYTADSVTTAKSSSSNVVILKFDNPVEHVFVWRVAPPEVYQNAEYAKRLRDIYSGGFFTSDTVEDKGSAAVKYTEVPAPDNCIRMTNGTNDPWADAPVLIFEEGRALGQLWLPYTPAGEDAELVIGPAADIRVASAEREVKRVIGEGSSKSSGKDDLITVEGFLQIENRRKTVAKVEVTRVIVGTLVASDNNAEVTAHRAQGGPNPRATLKWTLDVKPAEKKILTYKYTRNVSH